MAICNIQWFLLQLIDWGLLPKALLGVLALLCGNGYIVGINQIFDDDIDKVNKPFLPIASGLRLNQHSSQTNFCLRKQQELIWQPLTSATCQLL